MSALRYTQWTEADYLDLDAGSEVKYEYLLGEVYAMAGGKYWHSLIATNFATSLRPQLRQRGCVAHVSDLRIKIPDANYVYPDVVVVCGEPHIEVIKGVDTVFNPIILVEVLSPSTRSRDENIKSLQFRLIPSLQEYVLIDVHQIRLTQYTLQANQWQSQTLNQANTTLYLSSIDCAIPLADMYEAVDFTRIS